MSSAVSSPTGRKRGRPRKAVSDVGTPESPSGSALLTVSPNTNSRIQPSSLIIRKPGRPRKVLGAGDRSPSSQVSQARPGSSSVSNSVRTPSIASSSSRSWIQSDRSSSPVARKRGRPRKILDSGDESQSNSIVSSASSSQMSARRRGRPPKSLSIGTPSLGSSSSRSMSQIGQASSSIIKQRGRPRKNLHTDVGNQSDANVSVASSQISQKRRGRPRKSLADSSLSIGSSSSRSAISSDQASSPVARKRGRPRLDSSSGSPRKLVVSVASSQMSQKRRGRPPKTRADRSLSTGSPTSRSVLSSDQASSPIVRKRGRPSIDSASDSPRKLDVSLASSQMSQKRRGRPPKALADLPLSTDSSTSRSAPSSDQASSPIVRKRGRPRKDQDEGADSSTMNISNVAGSSQATTRKRGRPRKMQDTSATIVKMENDDADIKVPKKRGRPSKAANLTPSSGHVSPPNVPGPSSRAQPSSPMNPNYIVYTVVIPRSSIPPACVAPVDQCLNDLEPIFAMVDKMKVAEFHRRIEVFAHQIIDEDPTFLRNSSPR